MTLLPKRNLFLIITSLLLFGINISIVKANDCSYFVEATKYMGDEIKSKFDKVTNCCEFFTSHISCSSDVIKSIKLSKFDDTNADWNGAFEHLAKLENLKELSLNEVITHSNGIPSNIGKLRNLETLKLNNNIKAFNGTKIPDEINNLTNLENLELINNGLKGSIPKSLSKLSNLKVLDLTDNNLSGTIPFEFKDLVNLEELYLNQNYEITGYVPLLPELYKCQFAKTKLCHLPDSSCTQNIGPCTSELVRYTNTYNGSPYPDTDNYEKLSTASKFKKYKKFIYPLLAIIGSGLSFVLIRKWYINYLSNNNVNSNTEINIGTDKKANIDSNYKTNIDSNNTINNDSNNKTNNNSNNVTNNDSNNTNNVNSNNTTTNITYSYGYYQPPIPPQQIPPQQIPPQQIPPQQYQQPQQIPPQQYQQPQQIPPQQIPPQQYQQPQNTTECDISNNPPPNYYE